MAVDERGDVLGFAAATDNVRRLYKQFVLRDGLITGVRAFPKLARSWRRVIETLRYPGDHTALPAAELLAIAVTPAARGRGVGQLLVRETLATLGNHGTDAIRVTTAADNAPATGLYESCGFVRRSVIEVHRGTPSVVLTWTRS
jgi:ribosomal protein S18 acetylase RimI-like enzyme